MSYQIAQYHGTYNRTARTAAVQYIVVHYVGSGTSAAGSARNNCIYFSGGNRNASAHYFIDDATIYEYADPSAWACWHVGDGAGKYGITNANSVGIEVCNNGGPFTAAEIDRLHWLVRSLMAKFGVPAQRVVRHYDASRKLCPAYYAQNPGEWSKLHATITAPYTEPKPTPKQVAGNVKNSFGIGYRAHVERVGWLDAVKDGQQAGTTGFAARMEALKIAPPKGIILGCVAHVQNVGDVAYLGIDGQAPRSGTQSSRADPIIGTTGKAKRLEAITLFEQQNTTGLTLCYQGHIQNAGWTAVCHSGETCGSTGKGLRLEAIKIWLEA